MTEVKNNLQGQVVDGKFSLLRCLGESDHSIVFLTERRLEPQNAAIKLISASGSDAGVQIARWEAAAKLSHPHLIRLFEMGRCEIDGQPYLYLLMEYADENLYQILPDRPISAEEAREMLPPMLDALRCLHDRGLVHGHMKPANIMASGDQLKISSDGVTQAGQAGDAVSGPSLYDPPEAARTGFSPAWDIWSLGVTLVEALTQHPPSRKGIAEEQNLLPQSLPAPFSEIVRNCLRPRPEQRWSLDEISASLNPKVSPGAVSGQGSSRPAKGQANRNAEQQPTFAKPGRLLAACLITLMLLAFVVIKLWHGARVVNQSPAAFPAASAPPVAPPSASLPATVPQPSSANAPSKPTGLADITQQSNSTPATPPSTESKAADTPGLVVQQELPAVPLSASNTINGTIRVKVRVTLDPSGDVSSANLILPGSSQYFARLAVEASRKWKFAPVKSNGKNVSNAWILTFEFRRSGARAAAVSSK